MDPGLKVGVKASLTKTLSQADVEDFARISGDSQGLHMDDGYASGTRFKKRVAHGGLSIGLISGVLGTQIAGPGTTVVFLGLNCRFVQPVFLGDTVTATCEVTEIRPDRPIVTLSCVCTNQDGAEVLTGQATVLLDPYPLQ